MNDSREDLEVIPSEGDAPLPIDRTLVRKTVLGLALLLVFSGVCGWLFKEPIVLLGQAFLERFGLVGLLVGTIITDTSPLPLTHEPLTFLAIAAGLPTWQIVTAISAGSVASGPIGWCLGRVILSGGHFAARLEERQPELMSFMHRRGLETVAVAALLPLPFALSTWTAGMLRLPLPKVAAISLLRVVKVCFYFQLMKLGWLAGGG